MPKTVLLMAEHNLRESEELLCRQRDLVTALERGGEMSELDQARRLLVFLEAARDVHKTALARARSGLGGAQPLAQSTL